MLQGHAFSLVVTIVKIQRLDSGPRSTVSNVSGCRYLSDCRSRGREYDTGPLEIDHDIPPFSSFLLIREGLLSVISYKQKYVHKVLVNPLVKLAQEKIVVR